MSISAGAERALNDVINTSLKWALLKLGGNRTNEVVEEKTGQHGDFADFIKLFSEDLVQWGAFDIPYEMQRTAGGHWERRRYVILITWIGTNVSVLTRSKVSSMRKVVEGAAPGVISIDASTLNDLEEAKILNRIYKIGKAVAIKSLSGDIVVPSRR